MRGRRRLPHCKVADHVGHIAQGEDWKWYLWAISSRTRTCKEWLFSRPKAQQPMVACQGGQVTTTLTVPAIGPVATFSAGDTATCAHPTTEIAEGCVRNSLIQYRDGSWHE